MAGIEVANADLTLTVSDENNPTPVITSLPSTKVKANSKGVHKGQIDVVIASGLRVTPCTQSVSVNASILTTAQKVKIEGDYVMRKGDKVTVPSVTGVLDGGGGCTFPIDIEITNAGQTKVKAE